MQKIIEEHPYIKIIEEHPYISTAVGALVGFGLCWAFFVPMKGAAGTAGAAGS